jgi:hypothetical protein
MISLAGWEAVCRYISGNKPWAEDGCDTPAICIDGAKGIKHLFARPRFRTDKIRKKFDGGSRAESIAGGLAEATAGYRSQSV